MTVEITVLISAFTAVAGMILGLVSARRASRADLAKQSRETATIISEIGYVKSGIDDIKRGTSICDLYTYGGWFARL